MVEGPMKRLIEAYHPIVIPVQASYLTKHPAKASRNLRIPAKNTLKASYQEDYPVEATMIRLGKASKNPRRAHHQMKNEDPVLFVTKT